jgi:hypothetical protein
MRSPNPDRATRKLEDLPSDGGAAVHTFAGGLLRTFIRINELEAALARVTPRVAVLERSASASGEVGNAAATGAVADLPDSALSQHRDGPYARRAAK